MNKLLKISWGVFAPLVVVTSCLYVDPHPMTVLTAVTGILFVIGVAYRIPEGNLLGGLLCVFLALSSWSAGFYVNAMVNIFILFPMQIAAYIEWKYGFIPQSIKRAARNSHVAIFSVLALIYLGIGLFTGSNMLYHDAFSGAMMVTATFLLMSDTYKQWFYWIPCNLLEAIMWTTATIVNINMLPIAISRGVFLINSCIGAYEWRNHGRVSE